MLNLFARHKRQISNIGNLGIVSLISSLGVASVDTVWALYLFQFLQDSSKVGFLSGALTAISFFVTLALVPFIERMDEGKLYRWLLFIHALLYGAFAINRSLLVLVVLGIVYVIVRTARIVSFGIIVRDESKITELSTNEGKVFTLLNVGWLMGPLLAGYFADVFSISHVFVLAGIFAIMAFLMMLRIRLKKSRIVKVTHKNIIRNFLDYFRRWDRTGAYIIISGVEFWWTLIYIFVPIQMVKSGMSMSSVGFFLFLVVVPLLMFEYPAGRLAEKHGHKQFFIYSYLVLVMISFFLFFARDIYIMLVFMFIASFAIAFLEPLGESYFFKCIKKKDEDLYYPTFRTQGIISQTLGKISIASVLLFLPFNYSMLLVSGFMLFLFIVALFLKKV